MPELDIADKQTLDDIKQFHILDGNRKYHLNLYQTNSIFIDPCHLIFKGNGKAKLRISHRAAEETQDGTYLGGDGYIGVFVIVDGTSQHTFPDSGKHSVWCQYKSTVHKAQTYGIYQGFFIDTTSFNENIADYDDYATIYFKNELQIGVQLYIGGYPNGIGIQEYTGDISSLKLPSLYMILEIEYNKAIE